MSRQKDPQDQVQLPESRQNYELVPSRHEAKHMVEKET